MADSCTITEEPLYAGDTEPSTLAPGRDGNLAIFDPKAASHAFSVPLAGTNGSDGSWLIAHAEVCRQ